MAKINHNHGSVKRHPATKTRRPEHRVGPENMVQDPHVLAERLQRLMQDMANVAGSDATSLTCDDFEATIEFYVDAEIRGEPVRDVFPGLWKHLGDCEHCRSSHRLLLDALNLVPPPDLMAHAMPVPLPAFLQPAPGNARWSRLLHPRVGGGPLIFGVIIQTQHIRQRLDAGAPTDVRGGDDALASHPALILTDKLQLDDRSVILKVRAQRQSDPGFIAIALSLTGSTPLPDPLQVTLTWNGYTHTDLVHAGQYVLDRVPSSALAGEADLRIEFAADINPD